jgi:DNA-binding response OmpR family regulator
VSRSASYAETETAADAFLQKPEDIASLAATITRLLTKNNE